MRWAAKRDATEPGIIQALQSAGWTVVRVSDKGLPDLICARQGRVAFLECKTGKGKLQEVQVAIHARLRAAGLTVAVVRTADEALAAVGVVTQQRTGAMAVPNTRKPGGES